MNGECYRALNRFSITCSGYTCTVVHLGIDLDVSYVWNMCRYAPNHQHFFNMRLDFDVAGTNNNIYQMDVAGVPMGPENPYGNAFKVSVHMMSIPCLRSFSRPMCFRQAT